MDIKIGGHAIHLSEGLKAYIKELSRFEPLFKSAIQDFEIECKKADNLEWLIVYIVDSAERQLDMLFEYAVQYLSMFDIWDCDVDDIKEMYDNEYGYEETLQQLYLNDFIDISQSFGEKKISRESQSYFEGNHLNIGMGISGAIKSAIATGAINQITKGMDSIFRNLGDGLDNAQAKKLKKEVFEDRERFDEMVSGMYCCFEQVFNIYWEILVEEEIYCRPEINSKKANILYKNAIRLARNEEEAVGYLTQAIENYPFNFDYYKKLFDLCPMDIAVISLARYMGFHDEINGLQAEYCEKIKMELLPIIDKYDFGLWFPDMNTTIEKSKEYFELYKILQKHEELAYYNNKCDDSNYVICKNMFNKIKQEIKIIEEEFEHITGSAKVTEKKATEIAENYKNTLQFSFGGYFIESLSRGEICHSIEEFIKNGLQSNIDVHMSNIPYQKYVNAFFRGITCAKTFEIQTPILLNIIYTRRGEARGFLLTDKFLYIMIGSDNGSQSDLILERDKIDSTLCREIELEDIEEFTLERKKNSCLYLNVKCYNKSDVISIFYPKINKHAENEEVVKRLNKALSDARVLNEIVPQISSIDMSNDKALCEAKEFLLRLLDLEKTATIEDNINKLQQYLEPIEMKGFNEKIKKLEENPDYTLNDVDSISCEVKQSYLLTKNSQKYLVNILGELQRKKREVFEEKEKIKFEQAIAEFADGEFDTLRKLDELKDIINLSTILSKESKKELIVKLESLRQRKIREEKNLYYEQKVISLVSKPDCSLNEIEDLIEEIKMCRILNENDKNKVMGPIKQRQQKLEQEKIIHQQREEAIRRKQEEERQRREALENQKRQLEVIERCKRQAEENAALWEMLLKKNFLPIVDTYFTLQGSNGQQIFGIFKIVSNLLYLISVRIVEDRGIYKDQTLPVQFSAEGMVLKYDKKAVRIRERTVGEVTLKISADGNGNLLVSGMELKKDKMYTDRIIKNAKKPLLSFNKIMI